MMTQPSLSAKWVNLKDRNLVISSVIYLFDWNQTHADLNVDFENN